MNFQPFLTPWNAVRPAPAPAPRRAFASGLLAAVALAALMSVAEAQPPWADEFGDYHRVPPELRRYGSATLYRSVPIAGGESWVDYEPPWDDRWEEGVGDPDWDYDRIPRRYRRARADEAEWDVDPRWRYGQSRRRPPRPRSPGPDEWYDPYLDDDYFLDDHADEGADEPGRPGGIRVGKYPPYELNRKDPRFYMREYSDDYFSRQYFLGVERSRPAYEDVRTEDAWRDDYNLDDSRGAADELDFWWEDEN